MTDTVTLDKLNALLNKGGITDDMIISGVEFRHVGYRKIASALGMNPNDLKPVQEIINQLITKLRAERSHVSETYEQLVENDERYGMEKDFLGNVTIRDTLTGEETYLQGSEAAELVDALQQGADEQELLSHYMGTSHALTEDDDDSYMDEIETDKGSTYNFPWKTAQGHGTGTAAYSGKNKIKIISVRDPDGDELNAPQALKDEILKQAIKFIPEA